MGKHRKISPGDRFYNLEIIEELGLKEYAGRRMTFYKCKCLLCGGICEVPRRNLGVIQKDCGCGRHRPRVPVSPGDVYGRLKVLEVGELIPGRGYTYICECSCQAHKKITVRGDALRSGEVASCGCLHDEQVLFMAKKGRDVNLVHGTNAGLILEPNLYKSNSSGVRGVSWYKAAGKWRARIEYRGVTYDLGYYKDLSEADAVLAEARQNIYNDFVSWYMVHYPERWAKMQSKNTN